MRSDARAVGEVLQPTLEDDEGGGPGQDIRQQHQGHGFLHQKPQDIRHGRTQDLPDPHLLGALLGQEGDQAQKADAGDEDGQEGEVFQERSRGLLAPVLRSRLSSMNQ